MQLGCLTSYGDIRLLSDPDITVARPYRLRRMTLIAEVMRISKQRRDNTALHLLYMLMIHHRSFDPQWHAGAVFGFDM